MINKDLLEIVVCPESKQKLTIADQLVVDKLNEQIEAKTLKNRSGKEITEKIDGGLIREDGKYLYPIRQEIPILLVEEGIEL